ncbi:MAG: PDDEXK nuclease domain-containing protein, partial [Hyphomicrobiaceae bacterium]
LVDNICAFLLELGKGFSFMGSQYHIEFDRKDYYLDLLFYHVRLHCYVIFELKTTAFKPEYAGKMNFLLSVVDDVLRRPPEDKPSIGIILCEENSALTVEYALRDMSKPMGVAGFKITHKLPDRLQDDLPTQKELTARFRSALDTSAHEYLAPKPKTQKRLK